jgi:hypothetical protein
MRVAQVSTSSIDLILWRDLGASVRRGPQCLGTAVTAPDMHSTTRDTTSGCYRTSWDIVTGIRPDVHADGQSAVRGAVEVIYRHRRGTKARRSRWCGSQ